MNNQYKTGPASLFSMHARAVVVQECPKCHKDYELGINGTVEGCDDCTGCERASNGFAIEPECWCFEIQGDNKKCPAHGQGGE